ncbi:MAG: hypothetical protein M3O09_15085 [Acidobacteriota bacterium]|nr:hypothetical protein [Acidobacteriota bacterium]
MVGNAKAAEARSSYKFITRNSAVMAEMIQKKTSSHYVGPATELFTLDNARQFWVEVHDISVPNHTVRGNTFVSYAISKLSE